MPRDSSGREPSVQGAEQDLSGAAQGSAPQASQVGSADTVSANALGPDPYEYLDGVDPQALDPEVRAELEAQMAEVRQRILDTPVEAMIIQHVIGLFEIAAIHLNAENPDLAATRLAIDAMDGALSATEGRLGDAEEALQSMLHQARMAYVQVSQGSAASQN